MRFSIRNKLLLGLLLTASAVLMLNYALGRQQLRSGFLEYMTALETERYLPLADALAELYEQEGSFDGLQKNRRRWPTLLERFSLLDERVRPPRGGPPGRRGPPPEASLPLLLLVDDAGRMIVGPPLPGDAATVAVTVQGRVVGTLRYRPLPGLEALGASAAGLFLAQQQRALLLTMLAALAVAGLVGWLVARRFEQPLAALVEGAGQLAQGNYSVRQSLTTGDEFEQLAEAFNRLGSELEAESERRASWLMDVSHELRTPVAILRSEVDALKDGVREWNPQQAESFEEELQRLQRLLDDFHETTVRASEQQVEAFEPVAFDELLREELERFQARLQQASLQPSLTLPEERLVLQGSRARLSLLVRNLLENSLRYTDRPGQLSLAAGEDEQGLWFRVQDSAPGVPDDALPHLTERFYRVDRSRSRATGGSGLGLAITKSLVEKNQGTLSIGPGATGGLRVEIAFPLPNLQ